jgi:hypothetical protein
MLCNGVAADSTDGYIYIGESITTESMRRLIIAVVKFFKSDYLRSPNENDITHSLAITEERGFPSMLCSIDCMY